MLNHKILLYDSQGRIRNTAQAPREFNGGTNTRNRLLSTDPGVAQVYMGGLGYRLNGAICSVQALNASNNGFADEDGVVRSTQNPPTFWYCGLPFAANNLMSLSVPE